MKLSRKDKLNYLAFCIRVTSVLFAITIGFEIYLSAWKDYDTARFEESYAEGISYLESGDIDEALERFEHIPPHYRDVDELLEKHKVSVCKRCGKPMK